MYRPEGWKNPYSITRGNFDDGRPWSNTQYKEIFEEGADAILEGLREGATRVNNIGDSPQGKGVIVFIPEELKEGE